MIYARLLQLDLEAKKAAGAEAIDFAALGNLPKGLDEIYQQQFDRLFGGGGGASGVGWIRAEPVVNAIVAAREPPPAELLRRVFGKEECDAVLEGVSLLFPVDSSLRVRVMHKSVVDWLKGEDGLEGGRVTTACLCRN